MGSRTRLRLPAMAFAAALANAPVHHLSPVHVALATSGVCLRSQKRVAFSHRLSILLDEV